MDSSEIIVTFMTNGIDIHITEIILSKKIEFKSRDLNDENGIIHRDTLNADQKSNSSTLDENADTKYSELLNRFI